MFSEIKKQHLIILAMMLALFFGGGVSYGKYLQNNDLQELAAVSQEGDAESSLADPGENNEDLMVHVSGAVKKPGVFSFPTGKRWIDAVNLAVPREDADLSSLNLARKLKDQDKIVVPLMQTTSVPGDAAAGKTGDKAAEGTGSSLVNINLADENMLDSLPGIGPSKARAIIQYREENGFFNSVEDLQKVPGIGPSTFANLKELVTN